MKREQKVLENLVDNVYNEPLICNLRDENLGCQQYSGIKVIGFSSIQMKATRLQPLHIHVRKGENIAKFWLEPSVSVAGSYGMNSSELHKLSKVVEDNVELIKRSWDEYFN